MYIYFNNLNNKVICKNEIFFYVIKYLFSINISLILYLIIIKLLLLKILYIQTYDFSFHEKYSLIRLLLKIVSFLS